MPLHCVVRTNVYMLFEGMCENILQVTEALNGNGFPILLEQALCLLE